MSAPVPVLMFHSVAREFEGVPIDWLVYPLDLFEACVSDLAASGYHTPTMDELADHLEGRTTVPERSVVLTFDDGYLDNWVFVEPILRRHGLRGVVWVTTDFIEDGDEPRPTLADVWNGRMREDELQVWGYLNRGEIRALVERGTLEVQSHASTHTWWFAGPSIVDFHRPGSPHFWMAWNHAPHRKPFWLTEDQDEYVPWGTPVYENARAMVRRWFPDERLDRHVQAHVAENGGRDYFARPQWRGDLDRLVAAWRASHGGEGRYETDEEWAERVRGELTDVRDVLSEITGRPPRHHCWPGGDYSDRTEAIALDVGYRTTTIRGGRNVPGKSAPHRIDRISMPYRPWPGPLRALNRVYFRAKIEAYRNASPYRELRQGARWLRGLRGSQT